jgi:glycosyltransferase involved in cell wall biosynthesis
LPEATLRIVGRYADDETRQEWEANPGVILAGYVDDLRAVYEQCAFTIAPVDWGAGTKIKVLESLAYGRTCVVTPHALHGYGEYLKHGDSLWCCASSEAMVDGCLRLLGDPRLRERLAARGHEIVCRHFSIDSFRSTVHETCVPLLATT